MLFVTCVGIYSVLKTFCESLTAASQYHFGTGHYITIVFGHLHLPIIFGNQLEDLVEMEKMEDGYCVTNGTFKFDKWKILNYQNVNNIISEVCNYSKGCIHQSFLNPFYNTCLRRRFQCATPTYKHVYLTVNNLTLGNFYLFNKRVTDYWHNNVHNCVGRFHCLSIRKYIYI